MPMLLLTRLGHTTHRLATGPAVVVGRRHHVVAVHVGIGAALRAGMMVAWAVVVAGGRYGVLDTRAGHLAAVGAGNVEGLLRVGGSVGRGGATWAGLAALALAALALLDLLLDFFVLASGDGQTAGHVVGGRATGSDIHGRCGAAEGLADGHRGWELAMRGVEAGLDKVLALWLSDEGLELCGSEGVNEASLGHDEEKDLSAGESREFVSLNKI